MYELEAALDASSEQLMFALQAGRFSDFSQPLGGAILRLLRRVAKENFDGLGVHAAGGWPPLKPSTLAQRARLGLGGLPMMQRTRRLYRSLALGRRTEDSIVEVGKTSLRWGTSLAYAGIHQQTDRKGKIIPMRQVIPDPLPAEVGPQIRQILRDWIIEGGGA